MKGHFYKLPRWVILSPAKDLTEALWITLRVQRDTNSVGEIPHSVRADPRPK
jgi:hypothetical protein